MDPENGPQHDDSNLPGPTLWPVGFAIGIVVVLVGLIVDPLVVSSIGAAIAIVLCTSGASAPSDIAAVAKRA